MAGVRGLNENGPHGHTCLNTWSPVGGVVRERLGGVVVLEEVCSWRQDLSFPAAHAILHGLSASGCGSRSELSAAAPDACHRLS